MIVEGAPGLGKTSLLRAIGREGPRRGFEVGRARGAPLEREWPFGVARQLLEPAVRGRSGADREALLAGAARLAAGVVLGDTAAPVEVDATSGTLHGLYWLCANLAAAGPLLLVVDDAQWADEASLRFLGMLARRLDALPILALLAQRPDAPAALAELAADPQVERLALQPLAPPAVQALLAEWSPGGVDAEFAAACHAATGGNPFLLSRLGPGLREQDVPFTAAHASRVTDAGPAAVRDAVRATLARLPAATVALAEAVTVLGDDVELAVAAALAELQPRTAEDAAERLVSAGVLEDARPLRFIHAIVRDAVAADLSAGARSAWHARAAELLDARGAPPDAVAAHLLACAPSGRTWVVERLAAAAERAAARGAPAAATTLLERALDEPPDTPSARAELLLSAGRAAGALWTSSGARPARRAAHALTDDPVTRARAALAMTWGGVLRLEPDETVAALEAAITENAGDRELVLELEAARFTVLTSRSALLARTAAAGEFERWEGLAGATRAERLLLAALAIARMGMGGPAAAAADLAERAAGGQRSDAMGGEGVWLMFIFIVLYKTDRLDTADRLLDRELRAARERGSLTAYGLVSNFRGAIALRRGDLATAEAESRTALDTVPPDAWERPGRTSGLLDVLTETGQLDEAETILTAGGWDGELPDDRLTNVLLASRSRLRAARGDLRRALADALEARRRVRRPDGGDTNWDGWLRIALLHRLLGEPDTARAEADALLAAARRWDTPAAIGQGLRARGLVHDGALALAALHEAVAQLERSPARLELAHTLVDLGAALRRHGARADARAVLRRGLDLAADAGAVPLVERARQELTATGLRVRRNAQTGIASLTPSERRIVEHAAAGATNAQIAQALFVTVKTVEMHLANAYRKLDISSRQQLAQHLPPAKLG